MNNQIISYILHFELPNNCIEKDNIYFNNTYCEIIKTHAPPQAINVVTVPTSNKITFRNTMTPEMSSLSLFNCFTWAVQAMRASENIMITCIKNKLYDFFAKQQNNYDDIIRL